MSTASGGWVNCVSVHRTNFYPGSVRSTLRGAGRPADGWPTLVGSNISRDGHVDGAQSAAAGAWTARHPGGHLLRGRPPGQAGCRLLAVSGTAAVGAPFRRRSRTMASITIHSR